MQQFVVIGQIRKFLQIPRDDHEKCTALINKLFTALAIVNNITLLYDIVFRLSSFKWHACTSVNFAWHLWLRNCLLDILCSSVFLITIMK